MSRRRNTTARMFSGGKPGGPKRPSQSRTSTPDPTDGRDSGEPAAELLTAESLKRHLAAEALLRDCSEKRTATVLKRYLKLTMALAGINALVAGATMVALWSRADQRPEIAAKPSVPAAQSRPELSPPAPPATATPPASAPAPSPPVPAASPQPLPASKPEASVPTPRPRRPVVKIQVAHKQVEDTKTVALEGVVERW